MLNLLKKSNPFAPRQYGSLHAITDNVFIYRNITNSSFVIGDKGVAVIDTQVNQSTAEFLLQAIRKTTNKPILYVINTHYHWDHTYGNQLFKNEGARIISSALTKEFMTVRKERQKAFLAGRGFELGSDPLLADETFEGETHLDLGNMPLRLFFAGKAESDDATAVHVVNEGVLMAGDTIMTGSFPIFGQPVWDEGLQGDGQWQRTIECLKGVGAKHIVPGHGPLAKPKDIQLLVDIENYMESEVKLLVDQGMGLEAILKQVMGCLPDWMRKIHLVWGTPQYAVLRVYRGLTRQNADTELGWQQYKPSAIPQAKIPADTKDKSLKEITDMAHEAKEGGDMGMALSLLEHGAMTHDKDPDVLSTYADALIEASRSQDSVLEKGDFFNLSKSLWCKALELDENHLPSFLGLGRYQAMMAYRGGENPKRGMKYLSRVIDAAPGGRLQAEAEFYMGMAYRRLGDEEMAKKQFVKAGELDSSFFPVKLALGA